MRARREWVCACVCVSACVSACACVRVCGRARVCVGERAAAFDGGPCTSLGFLLFFIVCGVLCVCVCVCVCVPQPWMGDILNQLEEGVARARRPGGGGGGEAAACLAMLVMGMRAYIYLCIELVK